MDKREFHVIKTGLIYALMDVSNLVLGEGNEITRNLYNHLRWRAKFTLIVNPQPWLKDRMAAALQDFGVWNPEDADALKREFFV